MKAFGFVLFMCAVTAIVWFALDTAYTMGRAEGNYIGFEAARQMCVAVMNDGVLQPHDVRRGAIWEDLAQQNRR